MPGIAVHLHHAAALLEAWRAGGRAAPFAAGDERAVRAFLFGALAPDMGLYPGGAHFLSDLVHTHHSGDLCRALIDGARTDVQRGYAWGWLTHVLVDGALHPVVNADARALLRAEARVPPDPHAFEDAHLRVELGLEVGYVAGTGALGRAAAGARFGSLEARFLAAVLRDVYALRIAARTILAAGRSLARCIRPVLLLERRLATGAPPPAWPGRKVPRLVRVVLGPVRPSPRLAAAVSAHLRAFPELLAHHAAAGLDTLPNRDLDTGEPVRALSWTAVRGRAVG